ncbi:hypothetical protein UG55_1016152 [Frankia sp. EI5c]|uniref:hypothetical protein n=1 Tax=Frankia sp. EI5c TaxID=683316 RepID=UPI0007C27372|nr:hypothetical protein [Frankia sp. EI5c]OAA26487.1 hypothetical protein UG55_1016152 [Frankia sp. EI5c]
MDSNRHHGGMHFFHVTSTANRKSVSTHGLDWSRMGSARGIAGSRGPEVAGVFLCRDEFEADWFVRLNNTGGPVDVWEVDGTSFDDLEESPNGYVYLPHPIPAGRLTLTRRDLLPGTHPETLG